MLEKLTAIIREHAEGAELEINELEINESTVFADLGLDGMDVFFIVENATKAFNLPLASVSLSDDIEGDESTKTVKDLMDAINAASSVSQVFVEIGVCPHCRRKLKGLFTKKCTYLPCKQLQAERKSSG